jgi:hypothetical protein
MTRIALSLAVACIVIAAGFAAAKPNIQSEIRDPDSDYNVSSVANSAVLVDTATSRTWLLKNSVDPNENSVWIPITRLDDEEEVARWRAEEKERENQRADDTLARIRAKLSALREKLGPNHPEILRLEEQGKRLVESPEKNYTDRAQPR